MSIKYILGFVVVAALVFWVSLRPSFARDWSLDQALAPEVTFHGETVTVKNIRNFRYRTTTDYDPAYQDKTYDVRGVNSVWFVVEPFRGKKGAHTLLSFGFKNGEYLAVSPEIRKEKGETFSPYLGILKQYELMYVIADERDVLGLRANIRKDDVYVYPIKTTEEQARQLFVRVLQRANTVDTVQPEFYNTIWNSCNSNILDAFNQVLGTHIGLSYRTLFPEHTDEVLYEQGLIDTDLPLEKARERFKINDRAAKFADSEEFSRGVRE